MGQVKGGRGREEEIFTQCGERGSHSERRGRRGEEGEVIVRGEEKREEKGSERVSENAESGRGRE